MGSLMIFSCYKLPGGAAGNFIDDNAVTEFIDDNSATSFTDDHGV